MAEDGSQARGPYHPLYRQRGGVTERVIRLTGWILGLLHDMRNRLILTIVQICLSWLALISMLVDRASPCGPPSWRLLGR
jgi:hypothetical protein